MAGIFTEDELLTEKELRQEIDKEYPYLTGPEKEAMLRSRMKILYPDTESKLIQIDYKE